jgi:lipopolysaccharide transport system ATP-binding protein
MSKTVIEVNNLSKRYRIGVKEQRNETFAGQILSTLKAPVENFRRLRSMSKFGAEDESVFWALRDINFEVKEGEVLGIIGHNGAGKSTLLKILSRITEPTSGEIKIRGRISALLEVGTGFHPDLTGRENVYMNGTILGMTKREIDAKFDEMVDFSGVEKHIDTPVKFYSSGMKVRLGFAVAAHLEPEILILDEVLAVGDAEFQKKCLGKIQDVAENDGRTILFVSHNMAAIKSLCNNVLFLKNGKVRRRGVAHQVVQEYLEEGINLERGIKFKDKKNEFVDLKSVEIISDEEVLKIDKPLAIKFTYVVFSKIELNLSLVLYTVDEIPVFNTGTFIEQTLKGTYEATCYIPANFLNDGLYTCRILFVKEGSVALADFYNVISFEMFESTRLGNWYGKWIGVVRPKLEWDLHCLDKSTING